MKQDGFTLVEALVAIAILGVILAAIVSLLPSLVSVNARTTDEQRAVLAAKAYFESARSALRTNFEVSPESIAVPGVGDGLACTRYPAQVLEELGGSPVLKRIKLECAVRGRQYNFTLDVGKPL